MRGKSVRFKSYAKKRDATPRLNKGVQKMGTSGREGMGGETRKKHEEKGVVAKNGRSAVRSRGNGPAPLKTTNQWSQSEDKGVVG